jgi:hypothetical protein
VHVITLSRLVININKSVFPELLKSGCITSRVKRQKNMVCGTWNQDVCADNAQFTGFIFSEIIISEYSSMAIMYMNESK